MLGKGNAARSAWLAYAIYLVLLGGTWRRIRWRDLYI
jgi:hypothetical protein